MSGPSLGTFGRSRRLQGAYTSDYVEPLVQVLTPLSKALCEASKQLERKLAPALTSLHKWSEAIAKHYPEFPKWIQFVNAADKVGWLPYGSTPFEIVEECGNDLDLLDQRFSDYYRSHWSEMRDEIISRLEGFHIDDEARQTFREALSAHEAGHYRRVCRVLFPEIERMISKGRLRDKALESLAGTRSFAELAFRNRSSYILLGRLMNHAYRPVKDREQFESNPVPNRHAALHGLVSYSTNKHSMNMLILTDYTFQILPPVCKAA